AFPAGYKLPADLKGTVVNGKIMIHANPAPVSAPPAPAAAPAQAQPAAPVQPAAPAAAGVPQIGDVRITFTQILPHNISVVAQQINNSFCPYPVNGDTINLLADSIQSAELMFSRAQSANNTTTWILRIIGFLMMLFGLSMVFKPLSVLADVLPILGDIVEMGTSLVAFLIAVPCWLIVIAIAWIFYRPVLGIILLVIAAAFVIYLVKRRKKRKAAAPAA
ncbi:MAG: TMEM43 family protein, partial [Lentisphaeria bacterium]|nr:TMEM43 family protein [Lentisphaeria bacterium]